jgi:hypothetical protein
MFCPICGQQQAAETVRFCSRCGFLLTGVSEVVANQGLLPNQSVSMEIAKDSPRKRGVKQGVLALLIGLFLVTPILAMIHIATDTEPVVMAIAAIISLFGSIIRIIYALMFEEGASQQLSMANMPQFVNHQFLAGNQAQNALPPQQSMPVTDYAPPKPGSWHTTNDLVQPGSVTESTTRLLEKEEER